MLVKQLLPEETKSIYRFARNRADRLRYKFLLPVLRNLNGDRELVDKGLLQEIYSEFGETFHPTISCKDEMYRVTCDTFLKPGVKVGEIQRRYYRYGKMCRDAFRDTLRSQGKSLKDLASLLELPSGYGRVTRFLAAELPPEKIVVSDIDPAAVEFNSKIFGTQPLLSAEHPDRFVCNRKFEVVFSGMLFSHFNLELWHLWLKRMYSLVERGGLLVFSTMGSDLLSPQEKDDYFVEEGYWFAKVNETKDRLSPETYGNTWVSQEWVERQVRDCGVGELCGYYPRALANWQDIYVVKRRSE